MTTKLGPPPVEGLSDVAWARVERNVFTQLQEGTITSAVASHDKASAAARRTKLVWFAVPMAAAAAFALAFFATKSPQAPASQPVATDTPSRIVAGNAPSSITVGDSHLTLDANTALVIDGKEGKQTALIERGTVEFAVPRAFTVLAGDALVRTTTAQNAHFRVSRDGELAIVQVESGSVQVTFRGQEVTVGAHHAWSALKPSDVVDDNH
jgi:ferric-dicitrate binding protein FerR (iron transport regulator)